MNFNPLKVNEQYYHVYVTFTQYEINKYYKESINNFVFNTNLKLLSSDEIKQLNEEVKSRVIAEIEQAIMGLELIIISEIIYSFRGPIAYDTPLFVVAKFCLAPDNLELTIPNVSVNLQDMKTSSNLMNFFIDNILVNNNFVDLVEVGEVNSLNNVIIIEAIINGHVEEITLKKDDQDSFVDLDLLFGYNIGDNIPINFINIDRVTSAKIKNIYYIKPQELTDEIVRKLNIFNVKTKEEFIRKTFNVLNDRQNRNVIVSEILNHIINNSNIDIEDVVINHFLQLIAEEFSCSVEELIDEWDNLNEDHMGNLIYEIKKQYIVHYAYKNGFNYTTDEYYKTIKEEYNLHRAIFSTSKIQDYENYMQEQMDAIILFDFFRNQGLILK